jgi:hypothetical protein
MAAAGIHDLRCAGLRAGRTPVAAARESHPRLQHWFFRASRYLGAESQNVGRSHLGRR